MIWNLTFWRVKRVPLMTWTICNLMLSCIRLGILGKPLRDTGGVHAVEDGMCAGLFAGRQFPLGGCTNSEHRIDRRERYPFFGSCVTFRFNPPCLYSFIFISVIIIELVKLPITHLSPATGWQAQTRRERLTKLNDS